MKPYISYKTRKTHPLLLSDFEQIGTGQQILVQLPSTESHGNQFSHSGVSTCTDQDLQNENQYSRNKAAAQSNFILNKECLHINKSSTYSNCCGNKKHSLLSAITS
jgi:hypothetical protein